MVIRRKKQRPLFDAGALPYFPIETTNIRESNWRAAAIHHLMEDAATAEISRSQLWQWLKNEVKLDNDKKLTTNYYHRLAMEEYEKIKKLVGEDNHEKGKYNLAEQLLDILVVNPNFIDFLTIPGYKYI